MVRRVACSKKERSFKRRRRKRNLKKKKLLIESQFSSPPSDASAMPSGLCVERTSQLTRLVRLDITLWYRRCAIPSLLQTQRLLLSLYICIRFWWCLDVRGFCIGIEMIKLFGQINNPLRLKGIIWHPQTDFIGRLLIELYVWGGGGVWINFQHFFFFFEGSKKISQYSIDVYSSS